jgi:CRISPR-associated protein Cas2
MRLLVFFDLPTMTKADKRAYTLFRRFLLQEGYDMLQWSIYGRLVNGADDAEKHLKRLASNLPQQGSIRYLQISEKQFAGMKILVGERSYQEKKVNINQMLLF